MAYDCLQAGDRVLLDVPLIERKQILQELICENGRIAVSRYIREKGRDLFQLTVEKELEGVVEKKLPACITRENGPGTGSCGYDLKPEGVKDEFKWYADKWYKCKCCGTLWEFRYPDFPAKGFVRKFPDGKYRIKE